MRSGSSPLGFSLRPAFLASGALGTAFFGRSLVLDWSFLVSAALVLRTICGSLIVTGVKLYSGAHSMGRFLRVVSRNGKIAAVSFGLKPKKLVAVQ